MSRLANEPSSTNARQQLASTWAPFATGLAALLCIASQSVNHGSALSFLFFVAEIVCETVCLVGRRWMRVILGALFLITTATRF